MKKKPPKQKANRVQNDASVREKKATTHFILKTINNTANTHEVGRFFFFSLLLPLPLSCHIWLFCLCLRYTHMDQANADNNNQKNPANE